MEVYAKGNDVKVVTERVATSNLEEENIMADGTSPQNLKKAVTKKVTKQEKVVEIPQRANLSAKKKAKDDLARKKAQEFFNTLEKARGSSLLICIKGYPDPDNIGSSLALQWLASNYDIAAKIVYFEEISHYENRALVKKLDLELERLPVGTDVGDAYQYYSINDSQSADLPIEISDSAKLLTFVDHHKSLGESGALFHDVRESAGSTSALFAEYLQYSPKEFTGIVNDESKIATALMHGIRSDTDDFVNATSIDYHASEYLSEFMDSELLSLISKQAISAKTMDLTQVALQHKDIMETFLFSAVGYVREEDRDGIGQCADYLLHREGIETVVVFGIVGNSYVDGSLRTKSHTLDPDKWIKDVFGQDRDGKWYGGGRKDKGGFQIPLGVFTKCRDKELLWILVKKTIDELFHDKIGVDSSKSGRDSSLGTGSM